MAAGAVKLISPLCFLPLKSTSTPRRSSRRPSGLWKRRGLLPRPISSSLVEEREEDRGILAFTEPEARLLDGLLGIQGRGRSSTPKQLQDVEGAVEALEDLEGVPDPTSSSLIEGCWQLIFTTRPGTASPIQRTFVGVDFFSIFQEICLNSDDPRVSNIVRFSDAVGELKVEAAATINDGKRILFRFDRAAFSFKFLPFKVPYPVPFRLLGDEAKGWLDTTYLSRTGNMRISRGNKGTTFVLQKKSDPRQRLISAISLGTGVEEAIEELVSLKQKEVNEVELVEGEWQLLWASQLEGESWSETAATGLKGLQIVKKNGQLENVLELFPGFKVRAQGRLVRAQSSSYDVSISDGFLIVGSIKFPLAIRSEFNIELLYQQLKVT